MPFTGPYGFYGGVIRPPMEAYAEILNERGGIKIGDETYMLELVFVDDEVDPGKGPIAAQELINKGCIGNVGRFSGAAPIESVLSAAKLIGVGEVLPGYDITDFPYFVGGYDGVRGNGGVILAAVEGLPEVEHMGYMCYDWQAVHVQGVIDLLQQPGTPVSDRGIDIMMETVPMGQTDFTTTLTKFGEAGVQLVVNPFGPGDYALSVKQGAELGYDFDWVSPGTMTNIEEFISIAGYENCQNSKVMCNWPCPWTIQEQHVDPDLVELAREIQHRVAEKEGKSYTTDEEYQTMYMGQYDWGVNQLRVLLAFLEQAGTTDPDAVMEVVRGGTVHDFTGVWTMGGQESWGAPVVKAQCCQAGVIDGWKMVRFGEHSLPVP
jgi:ABC-type branched-subunit amino acid transport system substrate-binding protein